MSLPTTETFDRSLTVLAAVVSSASWVLLCIFPTKGLYYNDIDSEFDKCKSRCLCSRKATESTGPNATLCPARRICFSSGLPPVLIRPWQWIASDNLTANKTSNKRSVLSRRHNILGQVLSLSGTYFKANMEALDTEPRPKSHCNITNKIK